MTNYFQSDGDLVTAGLATCYSRPSETEDSSHPPSTSDRGRHLTQLPVCNAVMLRLIARDFPNLFFGWLIVLVILCKYTTRPHITNTEHALTLNMFILESFHKKERIFIGYEIISIKLNLKTFDFWFDLISFIWK